MQINTNFDERARVHAAKLAWKESPIQGVRRRMLDRIGDEVARATTIVQYDPDSQFSPHVHTGGEEFFVLEGVFSDEHGDFPAGFYIRNPPESKHTPGSKPGCEIFVKLWQFDMDDRTHIRIDTNKMSYVRTADREGVSIMPLFNDGYEDVRMERYDAGAEITLGDEGGLELIVVDGSFTNDGEEYVKQSWLRLPKGGKTTLVAGENGAKVWVKTGHLVRTPVAPAVPAAAE